MDRNSLRNEVIRAQDILKQIQMRFMAEYQLNTKIVEEIQVYKQKLQCMEDHRNLSLLEIEKHLSIIGKTNEELQQRLNNKDAWLSDADDDTESKRPDEIQAQNLTNFSNPLEMTEHMPNPSNASSLEKYLQDLYHELCTRVQAQQNKANKITEEPALELAEIKVLLDEGEKRLQILSAKNKGNWTKDDETIDVTVDKDGVSSSISSPQPKIEDKQKAENLALPLQDGWVSTRTSTPEQIPTSESILISEESAKVQTPSPKPVGPIRPSTFPADQSDMMTTGFGKGKDYFEEMFFYDSQNMFNVNPDYKKGRNHVSKSATPSLYRQYNATTSSAIGSLCILEINEEGKFVRLYNADRKDTEIGNYMIKQNVGGHPVIVFRFPPRTKFPRNSIITIWAASCDNDIFHDPPNNYIWDAQVKWGAGPEYTTILCKPNGQAIAWTNAAHRCNPHVSTQIPMTPIQIRTMHHQATVASPIETKPSCRNEVALGVRNSSHAWNKNLVFLKREKHIPNLVSCVKHPYGLSPGSLVHPCSTKEGDAKLLSRSSSPFNLPERTKSFNGHSSQRSSNAKGRSTSGAPTPSDMHSLNRNNSNMMHYKYLDFDQLSSVSFMKPSSRLDYGLRLIQAEHNTAYNPPMPRLSRSAW